MENGEKAFLAITITGLLIATIVLGTILTRKVIEDKYIIRGIDCTKYTGQECQIYRECTVKASINMANFFAQEEANCLKTKERNQHG